jgi:hypothetical protein
MAKAAAALEIDMDGPLPLPGIEAIPRAAANNSLVRLVISPPPSVRQSAPLTAGDASHLDLAFTHLRRFAAGRRKVDAEDLGDYSVRRVSGIPRSSVQSGRTTAPRWPHFAHFTYGPNDVMKTSSSQSSTLKVLA